MNYSLRRIGQAAFTLYAAVASTFLVGSGTGALAMRGNSVRVMSGDSLRAVRVRGLRANRTATRDAARTVVLPLSTKVTFGLAPVFSGSVVESVFTCPGVDWYTLAS